MLLHSDFFPRDPCAETFFDLWLRSQVLADCDPNVVQRLFARRSLAVAAWKVIAPNGETLFRFYDRHVVGHRPKNAALGEVAQGSFEVRSRFHRRHHSESFRATAARPRIIYADNHRGSGASPATPLTSLNV
jgi:hypothetical protein